MVDTNELRGLLAKNNISGKEMAEKLGITSKTFYVKMKTKKFNSEEMKILCEVLRIEDPIKIFFA